MRRLLSSILTYILLLLSVTAYGANGLGSTSFGKSLFSEPDFLPVDDAFVFSSSVEQNELVLSWKITDGYYLYKERFKFTADSANDSLGAPIYSEKGELKDDPNFGQVTVFHNDIEIRLPINLASGAELPVSVKYQGCADAGLCYPPQTKEALFFTSAQAADSNSAISASTNVTNNGGNSSTLALSNETSNRDLESADGVFSFIQTASLLTIVGIFFLLGVGLTFTPCVFPMIPIISSIIAGQKNPSTWTSFRLSLFYVLGMSLTYATAGVVTGMLGASANIQAYLQAPSVLITFSAIFLLLAFSMFGFYELQLPASIRDKLNNSSQNLRGGQSISVFLIGALSALIVSPCVSAPLAGALLYISTTADATLGGLSLFALGLGMGVPLIAVGTGGGKILPKAGLWMDRIKAAFGIMLIGVAIWLLERLISPSTTLVLWSLLLGVTAVQMGAFEKANYGWQRFWKGVGLILALYASTLFIGAITGAQDPLKPLENVISSSNMQSPGGHITANNFNTIYSVEELQTQISSHSASSKPVLLDFYADWCISCKVMERDVFTQPAIEKLMSKFTLIQADVTDNSAENQALLEHYDLFGPPTILFFDNNGNELQEYRIMGEVNDQQFIEKLTNVLTYLST